MTFQFLGQVERSDIFRSLTRAMESPLTWVIAILLLALMLVAFLAWRYARKRAHHMLGEVELPGVQKSFKAEGYLGSALDELRRRWQFTDDGQRYRLGPSSEVINLDGFLRGLKFGGVLPYRILDLIPGFATGLGILGTFLGISLGLADIDLNGAGGSDTTAIWRSVGGVVDGLATAFWTSIFGVVVSILVAWRTRVLESRIERDLEALCGTIDGWIPRLTPAVEREDAGRQIKPLEVLLKRILKSQKAHARTAAETRGLIRDSRQLIEDGGATLKSLSDDLVSKLADGFGRAVAPQLEKMGEAMRSVANAGVQSAKEFVGEMVAGLQGGINETLANLSHTVRDFRQEFGVLVGRLEESAGTLLVVLELAERAAERVRDKLGSLENIGQSLSGFEHALVGLQGRQLEVQESFFGTTQGILESFETTRLNLAESLGGIGEAVSALGSQFNTMQSWTNEINWSMKAASEKLEQVLERLGGRLRDELEAAQRYKDAAASLQGVAAQAAPVVAQIVPAMERLDETITQLSNLGENLRGMPTKVGTLVTLLGEKFNGVDRAAEGMKSVVTSTEAWAARATTAIGSFQTGIQEVLASSLSEYDKSLSTAVKSLGAAMEELETKLDEAAARASKSGG